MKVNRWEWERLREALMRKPADDTPWRQKVRRKLFDRVNAAPLLTLRWLDEELEKFQEKR